ncbi:MAG: ribosome-associated heat shock protein Hsp15 [Pseudomonadota bacterium]|nr:ribosome-associated heat shock protein Hsp15 [Pseudomonadota bacterium]
MTAASGDPVRLDKWLWAARFFKTRSQAAEAVSGGKVHVNQQRARPSRIVQVGDTLSIRRGPWEFVVVVQGLTRQRGPAREAARLYEETAASRQRREALAEQRRLEATAAPQPGPRPSKKDRRRIIRFTSGE